MIRRLQAEQLRTFIPVNEPFDVIGRIVPVFQNQCWSFAEELTQSIKRKVYPEEEIDFASYVNSSDKVIFLYYEGIQCVGQIRLCSTWNRFALIEDLAVSEHLRGRGIGTALLNEAQSWAQQRRLGGLVLETQDTNVLACRFYQRYGFRIGAIDTMMYWNTKHQDEMAVFWYFTFSE